MLNKVNGGILVKRKLILLFLTVAATLLCAFALSACGEGENNDDHRDDTPSHTHSYTDSVISPTCTERGYTLHTCFCNESYKDNYVDALGHNYVTYICARCGNEDPAKPKLNYTLNEDGASYSVTGIGEESGEEITIAAEYDNKPVIAVGNNAFQNCSNLVSVTIPSSVTSIGNNAFKECSGLTGVYIADLAAWCNIELAGASSNPLCYAHSLYLNNELVTELVIPDGITSIGNFTFYNCSNLISVTLPDSVNLISSNAFGGCSSLEKIIISENNTNFSSQNGILYNKDKTDFVLVPEGLKGDIVIPDSITSIGGYTFYNRGKISSVSIPDSVTYIGGGAFLYCFGLYGGVRITDLTAWCNIEFAGASSNPLYYAHFLYLNNELVTELVIPDDITTIGNYAFYECSSIISITIPDGVTSIGNYAFYNCRGFAHLTIPDSVTSIGENAFHGCSGLGGLSLGNGLTSIGENAFYFCQNLSTVTIPDSVTSIGNYAFFNCAGLTTVMFTGTEEQWDAISKSAKSFPAYATVTFLK